MGDKEEQSDETRIIAALRVALALIASDKNYRPPLGFAAQPIFRYYSRDDYWTLFSLAREMGVSIEEIRGSQCAPGVDRTVMEMRREAAYRLMKELTKLEGDVAAVISARARGTSWRKIAKLMKGRVFYSLMDDFRVGCRRLLSNAEPEIRELSFTRA